MSHLFGKPFALSIGPQACGSDILHGYFKTHRRVILPKVKEIFFFDRHVQRGADFYKSHFDDRAEAELFMELTTTAFDHPQAPGRVQDLCGQDAKLFCPLRDPVDRAYAVYKQYLRYGIVKGSIEEACEEAPQILFASRYADHVENWLAHFKDIHFLSYEALQRDMDGAFKALCTHLDITFQPRNKFRFPDIFMRLQSKIPPKNPPQDGARKWLQDQLGDEAQRLEKLVNRQIFG